MNLIWALLLGLAILYIYNYEEFRKIRKDFHNEEITLSDYVGAQVFIIAALMMIPIGLMMTCRLTNNVRLRRKYVDRSRKEESPLQSLYMMACCRACAYGEIGEFIESNRVYSSNSTRQFEYAEM